MYYYSDACAFIFASIMLFLSIFLYTKFILLMINSRKAYHLTYQIYKKLESETAYKATFIKCTAGKNFLLATLIVKDLNNKEREHNCHTWHNLRDKKSGSIIDILCLKECLQYIEWNKEAERAEVIQKLIYEESGSKIHIKVANKIPAVLIKEDLEKYAEYPVKQKILDFIVIVTLGVLASGFSFLALDLIFSIIFP